eukprot:scaffold2128_cov96-Isochrysis_galbana.AAC.1
MSGTVLLSPDHSSSVGGDRRSTASRAEIVASRASALRKPEARKSGSRMEAGAVATASAGDRPAARRSAATASARTLSEPRPSICHASKMRSIGQAEGSRAELWLPRPPLSSISWHEARVTHSRAAQ